MTNWEDRGNEPEGENDELKMKACKARSTGTLVTARLTNLISRRSIILKSDTVHTWGRE